MNKGISILFRAIPLAMAVFCFCYGAFIYNYGDEGGRLLAGPVVFSLGMICIALFCTAATIIRQVIHTYSKVFVYVLPIVAYLSAVLTLVGGGYLLAYGTGASDFVAGHVVSGVGLITMCVATVVVSSTRFSLIPINSSASGNDIPAKAFSRMQVRLLIGIAVAVSLVAWGWAFSLLVKSNVHMAYFVAGHVLAGLACICTSLVALVAIIARQVRNVYGGNERIWWPELVLLMGTLSWVWGLFVALSDSASTSGVIGYIMIGLGLVCYSISSKVLLLANSWKRTFALAGRIPLIPILTAFVCLFLAAFLFEIATVHPDCFVPARVLVGLGGICFTLFSIVSILESRLQ